MALASLLKSPYSRFSRASFQYNSLESGIGILLHEMPTRLSFYVFNNTNAPVFLLFGTEKPDPDRGVFDRVIPAGSTYEFSRATTDIPFYSGKVMINMKNATSGNVVVSQETKI